MASGPVGCEVVDAGKSLNRAFEANTYQLGEFVIVHICPNTFLVLLRVLV